MRNLKTMVAVLALMLCMVGCGNNPKSVATKFMTSMAEAKVEEAKTYATPETGKVLDMMNQLGAIKADPNATFEVTDVKIDGDTAVVKMKDKDGQEGELNLVKTDGKWLVKMAK